MKYITYLCLVITIFFITVNSLAIMGYTEGQNFSMTPILPDNQNKEISSYFDLKVKPGEEQRLQIKIMNLTEQTQKYQISINTAGTNNNGIVDYTLENFVKDKSMLISLKECVQLVENQVEIPANEEKTVEIDLIVPEVPFDGILLGGVTVEPITKTNNTGISNVFTRTIAIRLNENEKEVIPELQSGDISVSQSNLRNTVSLELRNVSPVLMSNISSSIIIKQKRNGKVILKEERNQLSVAPNSQFKYTSEWNDALKPGEYTYSAIFKDSKGHEWKFSKDFSIEKKKADHLNATSVDERNSDFSMYYYLLIAVVAILVLISIIRMKKRR